MLVGAAVGALGLAVGTSDGAELGLLVGAAEGASVGLDDGADCGVQGVNVSLQLSIATDTVLPAKALGAEREWAGVWGCSVMAVARTVGAALGARVGHTVGAIVGLVDGLAVGVVEGDADGSIVGA